MQVGDKVQVVKKGWDRRTKPSQRSGEIVALTPYLVTVNYGSYRESFDLGDLATRKVRVLRR